MPVLRSLVIAFSTYSRIPMPQVEWSDENRKYTMCFFPLVGTLIGLALWGWLTLCGWLEIGALLRGAAAALIPLMITGGIHMDGFMDTSDALASWQPVEKRLEILKDSHVGAFAVMGCAGYLLLSAGIFSQMSVCQAPMMIACCTLSRAMSAWALAHLKSVRPGGMADAFSRPSHKRMVTVSACIYAVVCIGIWMMLDIWIAIICTAAAFFCLMYYRNMAYRHFGGVTRDLAGWFVQITELILPFVIVLGGKIL